MVTLLLAAFLLGPSIAVLLLTAIVSAAFDRYPQAKERIEREITTRLECSVCGAHEWNRIPETPLPRQRRIRLDE